VPRTRLLLVDLPRVLRDLIMQAVATRSDIELVGEVSAPDSVPAALERYAANAVILPAGHPALRGQAKAILKTVRADVRVVALEPDGRSGLFYDLEPRQTPLGEVSPDMLMELIGRASRRR
jgi:DNA-binding NarL/FixJ family response regulator